MRKILVFLPLLLVASYVFAGTKVTVINAANTNQLAINADGSASVSLTGFTSTFAGTITASNGILTSTMVATGNISVAGTSTLHGVSATSITNTGTESNSGLMTISSVAASGYMGFAPKTTAQLNAIIPTAIGQAYFNSSTGAIWVSSGVLVNQFWHYAHQ